MDEETAVIVGRIVQEVAHQMPAASAFSFAERLRHPHEAVSHTAQSILDAFARAVICDLTGEPFYKPRPQLRVIEGGRGILGMTA
jgi:hypothetical protein